MDSFTRVETWATLHWTDDARFYRALDLIVRKKGFNSYELEAHLREKYFARFSSQNEYNKKHADLVCEGYRKDAEAVHSYLRALGQVEE